MALRHDQELRRELLYRAMAICSDPKAALRMAIRMERFILEGGGEAAEVDAEAEAGAADGPAAAEAGPARNAIERRRWTEADDRALRQLWDEKLAVDEIARRLERTPASIYGRLRWFSLNPARLRASAAADLADPESAEAGPAAAQAAAGEARPADPAEEALVPAIPEAVVRFLRSRDYSVVRTDDGRYRLDGREVLTAQELLRKANRVRESLGQPGWPGDVPQERPRAERAKTHSS